MNLNHLEDSREEIINEQRIKEFKKDVFTFSRNLISKSLDPFSFINMMLMSKRKILHLI